MKDQNRSVPNDNSIDIAAQLRAEARRIPAPERPGLVAQVMQDIRASSRHGENERRQADAGWMPWLLAGASAAASIAIIFAVAPDLNDTPSTSLPRQANLPRIVESRVDPVLASREQDLSGELQRIRADLNSIGRMVSLRLESDSQ